MIKLFIFCFLVMSCATVDIDRNYRDHAVGSQNFSLPDADLSVLSLVIPEPEVIVVERPVFVPEPEQPPRTPAAGIESVRASNTAGIIRPEEYSHAAMVYDYNPDWVYEIYAQPLRVTDITLQPGERAVEPPFVSDSERWIIGAGLSYENGQPVQHIYVKPETSGLEASLIINTDRRVYRIILRSYATVHMPFVRWRYTNSFPQNYNFVPSAATSSAASRDGSNTLPGIDPRFLSLDYRITYSFFSKPYWLPELVFDDGMKTYISFPSQVLQREMPVVFENRRDVVNYRVIDNLIVIDKLVETITVRIGRTQITITKKRG